MWNSGKELILLACAAVMVLATNLSVPAWARESQSKPDTSIPAAKEAEPNDEFISATPIDMPSRTLGTIFPGRDVDAYKFRVASNKNEVVAIRFINTAMNIAPNIAVYDQEHKIVGKVFSGKGAEAKYLLLAKPNQDFRVLLFSSPVNYFKAQINLEQRDKEQSKAPYTLEVRLAGKDDGVLIDQYEPNDDPAQATALELGARIQATLDPMQDVDVYKINLTSNKKEVIRISLENSAKNIAPNLVLYNDNREVIGYSFGEKGAAENVMNLISDSGTPFYVLAFSQFTNFRDAKFNLQERDKERSDQLYTLKVETVEVKGDSFEPNDELKDAKPAIIGDTAATINPPFDCDCFRVRAVRKGKMRFTVLNPSMNVTPSFVVYTGEREKLGETYGANRGAAKVSGEMTRVKAGQEFIIKVYSGSSRQDNGYSEEGYTLKVENPE